MNPIALHTSAPATVDGLRSRHASALVQAMGVVAFSLLTVLAAKVQVYVWEVPITLQTLAVFGAGLFLGGRNGALSQLLYLALGLALPVFAGSAFGPAYLLGATGGYLVVLPLVAYTAGRLTRRWNTFAGSLMALALSSALLFTVGVVWLHFAAGHATWLESIDKGFLRFAALDAAKIGVAALLYSGARRLG